MGLADELMNGVIGHSGAMVMMRDIATNMERDQEEWIAALRDAGIKAAHPDDGWVDREENTVQLCYPQFDDGVEVGDLIALGWPKYTHVDNKHRIVRVTERIEATFSTRYAFESVEK